MTNYFCLASWNPCLYNSPFFYAALYKGGKDSDYKVGFVYGTIFVLKKQNEL